jgi:glucose-1-phosphate thymidylyltransferase
LTVTRAVILARGLGTRMRAADPDARLTADQQRMADAGLKAMIPVHGRPFLDYILSGLADAGLPDVALVVAPDHDALRRYYTIDAPPSRTRITFIVQPEARGTADAVLTVEDWTRGEDFLAMNGDNLYPTRALADLAALAEPGLPAFDRDDLIRSSNIPEERIRSFAIIEEDDRGYLTHIVEKPADAAALARTAGRHGRVSMNCWRFDARIFQACRDVPRSARGEYELPEAVGLAVARGVPFRALTARGPVLDLSRRTDAATIAAYLADIVPHP